MRHRTVSTLARLMRIVVLAASLFMLPLYHLQAQIGGTIGYGSSVYGSIAAAGQSSTYSFNGGVGDLVQIGLRSWAGTLDPRLDLTAPDGQITAGSTTDPFSDDPLEVYLSLYLPQTGIYSLHISGENSTSGDFVLTFQGRGSGSSTPLLYGQSTDVVIPLNASPQSFTFEIQACPTAFIVTNPGQGQPYTFPFALHLFNSQGTQIAQLYGGDAIEDRLMLISGGGRYEAIITSDDSQSQGTIQLLVSCLDQAPGCVGSGQAGAFEGNCPLCVGDGEGCGALGVSYSLDGLTALFSWSAVEGADWYIFSIVDAAGGLLADSPRLVYETGNSYTFHDTDFARAPFTAFVSAGSEDENAVIDCVDSVTMDFEGMTTASCSGIAVGADVVPGVARAAVVHWGAVPNVQAYLIHVMAIDDDGSLIGIRVLTVPGDASTYHLTDVFPSDYQQFQIRVDAYAEGEGGGAWGDMPQGFLCEGITSISFTPVSPVHWGGAATILNSEGR